MGYAMQQGPEVISLTMTPVLIVYSTLFARWAWGVKPHPTLTLCACHVTNVAAQLNQLRRGLEFKIENGEQIQVNDVLQKVGVAGAATAVAIAAGPRMRTALGSSNLGMVSAVEAADASPFTDHFWAPMSKWFISGASFMDIYALLVTPINYTLCSVNIALFGSSAWHLGRKVKVDFIDKE